MSITKDSAEPSLKSALPQIVMMKLKQCSMCRMMVFGMSPVYCSSKYIQTVPRVGAGSFAIQLSMKNWLRFGCPDAHE